MRWGVVLGIIVESLMSMVNMFVCLEGHRSGLCDISTGEYGLWQNINTGSRMEQANGEPDENLAGIQIFV